MISIGNLQINKLCLGDVEVTKAYLGDVQVYGLKPKPEGKYMTITVLDGAEGTVISPTVNGTLKPKLQYRINSNGDWTNFIVGTTADIHVMAGDWVQFKGNNPSGISTSQNDYLNFYVSGNPVSLSGNVMSLIDGVGDSTVIPSDYCFYYLFHGSNVKTVSSDFLPATTLTKGCYFDLFSASLLENSPVLPALIMQNDCYRGMFYGCEDLTQAPALPATTLANSCYAFMLAECHSLVQAPALHATELATECYRGIFQGCTALTQAPALPATELANYCYKQMFYWCTALTQSPELPATTLAEGCYQFMFYGCSSLNYVKSLATNITATNALNQWLSGVAASGTFVKSAGVTYPSGASGIPSGWTVIEIKYLTMTPSEGVTGVEIGITKNGSVTPNLQYRVNNGDWTDWVFGTSTNIIANSGDVVQWKGNNPNGLSTSSSDYINFNINKEVDLSGNVMSLIDGIGVTTVIPCNYCFYKLFYTTNIKTVSSDFLPATTLTTNCYESMFQSCDALTKAPELPAITLKDYCYVSMFQSCDALTKAPELPATTLGKFCYQFMFYLCSSLTTAPSVLPATTLKEYCYYYMFSYCSKLSRIKCLATNISATYCTSGWLLSVASSGTFVKPAGVSYKSGSSGIPSGWTVEEI